MHMSITNGKGLHLRMDNGVVLSIQIGGGNYCDNRSLAIFPEPRAPLPESGTAEIAVWIGNGGAMLALPSGDTVAGYVPVQRIFDAVPRRAALKNPEPADVIAAFGPEFFDY